MCTNFHDAKLWKGKPLLSSELSLDLLLMFLRPQVEDFAEFRSRLDNSLQKSLSTVEVFRTRLLRGLLETPQIDQAVDDLRAIVVTASSLYDNRDHKTLPNFQRRGSSSIWDQTALGCRTDVSYHSFTLPYAAADVS